MSAQHPFYIIAGGLQNRPLDLPVHGLLEHELSTVNDILDFAAQRQMRKAKYIGSMATGTVTDIKQQAAGAVHWLYKSATNAPVRADVQHVLLAQLSASSDSAVIRTMAHDISALVSATDAKKMVILRPGAHFNDGKQFLSVAHDLAKRSDIIHAEEHDCASYINHLLQGGFVADLVICNPTTATFVKSIVANRLGSSKIGASSYYLRGQQIALQADKDNADALATLAALMLIKQGCTDLALDLLEAHLGLALDRVFTGGERFYEPYSTSLNTSDYLTNLHLKLYECQMITQANVDARKSISSQRPYLRLV